MTATTPSSTRARRAESAGRQRGQAENQTGIGPNKLGGRVFGGLVLAAFVFYGFGSALAAEPAGLVLATLNSLGVAVIGGIGFRLIRSDDQRAAVGYLAARLVEAVVLWGGIALVTFADATAANDTAYQLAMLALGIGSVPFFQRLGHRGWLPTWFANWGIAGYTLLAIGALLDLSMGAGVALVLAIPGGVFEIALGGFLLRRGFTRSVR